jgi:hypothetical protein
MPIVSPPKLGVPYWTAFSPVEGDSAPVDPLRFETYAERLGNQLFPGITNRVERVRYFGMVCAGIEAAGAEVGARASGREHTRLVRQRFTRFEAAWAYAMVAREDGKIKERPEGAPQPRLRYEFRGFRGANRVLAYWHKARERTAVDGRGGYRLLQAQEAQGGLGSYLVALREHGFVHPDRLALTAAGASLVRAFYGGARRDIREAVALDGRRAPAVWYRTGERLRLDQPSPEERTLVGNTLFATHRTLGRFVALLPPELRCSWKTAEAFEFVASTRSDLAGPARFTLAFDDLRTSCLELFAGVGLELTTRSGPQAVSDVLPADRRSSLTAAVQTAAAAVKDPQAPDGLEPVAVLATELAASSEKAVFSRLVDFHQREGRRWIESAGNDRFQLSTPGTFQEPNGSFHGYTLNAALSVLDDVAEQAA